MPQWDRDRARLVLALHVSAQEGTCHFSHITGQNSHMTMSIVKVTGDAPSSCEPGAGERIFNERPMTISLLIKHSHTGMGFSVLTVTCTSSSRIPRARKFLSIGDKCCHMSLRQSPGNECSASWKPCDTAGSRTIDTLKYFQ